MADHFAHALPNGKAVVRARFEPSFRVAAAALNAKSVGEVLAFTGSSLAYMPSDIPYMQPGAWRMSTGILAASSDGVGYLASLWVVITTCGVVSIEFRREIPSYGNALQPTN